MPQCYRSSRVVRIFCDLCLSVYGVIAVRRYCIPVVGCAASGGVVAVGSVFDAWVGVAAFAAGIDVSVAEYGRWAFVLAESTGYQVEVLLEFGERRIITVANY